MMGTVDIAQDDFKTRKIYKTILKEVHNLIKGVNKETQNNKLSIAFKMTKTVLSELETDIETEYTDLKKNAEWKKFTIVLYGETNAGKSTVIETLRIILKERTKVANVKKIRNIEKKKLSEDEKYNLIKKYSDGIIIGNGQSDYTRENQIYTFDNGSYKYSVVDVPGIEGNESQVIREIMEAVQKAHVVFWVTRKETPPQIGEYDKGILGKIKKHLGRQAEVWTIFNKSVTNVNMLKKFDSHEEIKKLGELHSVLVNQLGERYKGELVMSAYPAFLAVAENLDRNSIDYRKREKFLQDYSKEEILKRTGFFEFNKMLKETIVNNIEDKIIQANREKVIYVLNMACDKIESIKTNTYEGIQHAFNKNYTDSSAKLKKTIIKFEGEIKNNSKEVIWNIMDDIRRNCYERIEKNIKKKEYKVMLKESVEWGTRELESKLRYKYNENIIDLKGEIENIVNGTMDNYGKLIEIQTDNSDEFKFEFNFDELLEEIIKNMDSGINWKGFISSIIGASITVILTEGVALVAGLLSALVAAINSILSFFSDSYRRKQQKKGVEKLIEEMRPKFQKSVNEIEKDIYTKIRQYESEVDDTLKAPCNEIDVYMNNLMMFVSKLRDMQKVEVNYGK